MSPRWTAIVQFFSSFHGNGCQQKVHAQIAWKKLRWERHNATCDSVAAETSYLVLTEDNLLEFLSWGLLQPPGKYGCFEGMFSFVKVAFRKVNCCRHSPIRRLMWSTWIWSSKVQQDDAIWNSVPSKHVFLIMRTGTYLFLYIHEFVCVTKRRVQYCLRWYVYIYFNGLSSSTKQRIQRYLLHLLNVLCMLWRDFTLLL